MLEMRPEKHGDLNVKVRYCSPILMKCVRLLKKASAPWS
jgi:hypothetical protein